MKRSALTLLFCLGLSSCGHARSHHNTQPSAEGNQSSKGKKEEADSTPLKIDETYSFTVSTYDLKAPGLVTANEDGVFFEGCLPENVPGIEVSAVASMNLVLSDAPFPTRRALELTLYKLAANGEKDVMTNYLETSGVVQNTMFNYDTYILRQLDNPVKICLKISNPELGDTKELKSVNIGKIEFHVRNQERIP